MLCFASGTDREQERELLFLGEVQVVRWPAKRGRPAQNRNVWPGGGESARVPTGKLLRSEARVARFGAEFAFMLEGLTFDMSGSRRRRGLGPE